MKKVILFFIATLIFSSCSDFLEETNRNSITGDVLYNTPEGYESLVNACYSYSRAWYGKPDGYAFTEMGTDCYTGGGADCGRAPFMAFYTQDLQGSQTLISYMWNILYNGLNACNAAIGRADEAGLSDDLKKQRLGEVHFLRALYLHLITETWGDVILYTEETKAPVNTARRSSIEDFYTQIFADLDDAINLLPATPVKDNGRVTQLAAKALKARMCLYRGNYADAISLAKEVVGTSGLDLYDTFKETFDINNSEGQNNKEAIWWVDYSSDASLYGTFEEGEQSPLRNNGGNGSPLFSAMSYWMVSGCGVWVTPDTHAPWVQCMPTIAFLDMFDEQIDQRYDATFRTAWYVNSTTDNYTKEYGQQYGVPDGLAIGDTAFVTLKNIVTDEYRASKRYKIFDRNDVYDTGGKTIGTRDYFVSTYKFEDNTKPTGWEYESKRDAFVLRIGEMYLLLAEAELMNGNPGEAVNYMNILRRERAVPGKEEAMEIKEPDLDIDFILDERARELAGEQHRFFDLKRTGKLIERVKKYNPDAAGNIEDFHNLRPIPQDELDAIINKEEFRQNPGYK